MQEDEVKAPTMPRDGFMNIRNKRMVQERRLTSERRGGIR